MFYYAYLNELDVVQAIYGLPSQITDSRYILVPTNDQTLIGKKYNRTTGQFEDAVFYYAVLNNKDIVVEVISSLTPITDSSKILIASNDTTLIGKWYNRQTAQFLDPPIHVLADHSTQQINLVNQDKWLQTELDEMKTKATGHDTQLANLATKDQQLQTGLDAVNTKTAQHDSQLANLVTQDQQLQTGLNAVNTKTAQHDTQLANLVTQDQQLQAGLTGANTRLTTLENSGFGGYKCTFNIEDNERTTSEYVYDNGKHYSYSFNTGLAGYFPRMIRLVNGSSYDPTLVADFYIVRNPDGTVKHSYVDKTYIGIPLGSTAAPTRRMEYDIDMGDEDVISIGHSGGHVFDEGGSAFFDQPTVTSCSVDIGHFNYTENTFSFDLKITSNVVGDYTMMDLKGYVF